MAPRVELGSTTGTTPVTPSKHGPNAHEYDLWFLELSNDYNLNLKRSPPNLSPHKKRALPYYWELQFYERLRVHYWKGTHIDIRARFEQGAKDIHIRWVKKPLGDPGVTPFPSQLPRVTTEPERCQLLDLLSQILKEVDPVKQLSRASTPISSYLLNQSVDEPPSPSLRRRSKRHSDEWEGSPSKKSKSTVSEVPSETSYDPDDETTQSVLSVIDRGQTRSSTPLQSRAPSIRPPLDLRSNANRSIYGLTDSVNTSRSTFISEVFSDHNDNEPPQASQETQYTVQASAQEQSKFPVLSETPKGSDSNSLAPSSSTERALQISFNSHENIDLQQNVRKLLDTRSSTRSFSDVTFPEEEEVLREQEASCEEEVVREEVLRPGINVHTEATTPAQPAHTGNTSSHNFEQRLDDVWPHLPSHYDKAPFAVRWELLRVALHCGIRMDDLRLEYDPTWNDQNSLWARLQALPVFQGKSFPEKSRPEAWMAGLKNFQATDQVVILSASLTVNKSTIGPLFHLQLSPLKLDLPHRLDRRFGSDRFLEMVMPSMNSSGMRKLGEPALEDIHRWLVGNSHVLVGRIWSSFFVKTALPKRIATDDILKSESRPIPQERVYLFAEDGNDFHLPKLEGNWAQKGEAVGSHTKMGRGDLIDWLLQISKNQDQPVFKLFSRIALGLSRTRPTVILQPEEIRHRSEDVLSPTGKVMNDGISRISNGLAHRIAALMGLTRVPAGFQARFGSAKGFWIRDTTDTTDNIWIETTPSQRKWKCDYLEADHRTFEVRSEARELKAANLNLQLLPILEDRAIDPAAMKVHIGDFMRNSLLRDLESQKTAMQDPIQFRLWVDQNSPSNRRTERIKYVQVPFAGGLPTSREDRMAYLLDHGFDPTRLEFLRKIAWDLQKQKCEELQERLNVKVGRSTYAYMVVDFAGILEEDEVHLGFSSNFTDEQSGFSETLLHGMDLLVARTPAHYPSDIQRVKAVFKPELSSLKDVIVFSTKGNIPLADKLSGGDYDGDIAWICWEPAIVNNFQNADLPTIPNLFEQGIISKDNQTYRDLAGTKDITSEFLSKAFRFNMQQSLLGICTNYKERLCYARRSVRDDVAVLLSTLISHLVDRAKQGIIFTTQDWARLRKTLDPTSSGSGEPEYKKKHWVKKYEPTHIIDYVKFRVGQPTVEIELKALGESLGKAEHFDKDLLSFYQHYEKLQRPLAERKDAEKGGLFKNSTWEIILGELRKDIDAVFQEWATTVSRKANKDEWDANLATIYSKWENISPTNKVNSKTLRSLQQESQAQVGFSSWDLLKASLCFKLYYRTGFVWHIAGRQLAHLKAYEMSKGIAAPPALMIPSMYAGMRPDAKYARALAARNDGRGLLGMGEDEGEDEDLSSTVDDA